MISLYSMRAFGSIWSHVAAGGGGVGGRDFLAKWRRGEHFDLRAVAQDVAQELAIVAVGEFEHVRAVGFEARAASGAIPRSRPSGRAPA